MLKLAAIYFGISVVEKVYAGSGWGGKLIPSAEERHTLIYWLLDRLLFGFLVVFNFKLAMWAFQHRVVDAPKNLALQTLLLVIGFDFLYYWAHRTMHRFKLLWLLHSIHHSPSEISVMASGLRGNSLDLLLSFAPVCFIIPWFGFDLRLLFVVLAWTGYYQTCIHTRVSSSWGILDRWLQTPKSHRMHHLCTYPEFQNKNFGVLTVIFDRLFGTFLLLPNEEGQIYGIHPDSPRESSFFDLFRRSWSLRRGDEIPKVEKKAPVSVDLGN